jgi:ABC-2 type transport system ATP-binding protein
METVITVKDLRKTYKPQGDRKSKKPEIKAVDGISFEVGRGEFFGLLGPNGAGKTTTIGVLTTRVRPSDGIAAIGSVDVLKDPVAVKRQIGVVPQVNNLDRSLTARENLLFHAEYFGVPKHEREKHANELLERFQLAGRADEKTIGFSGGMAQRLKIARALMHTPSILFLDEPTTGLDPQSRRAMWDLLSELHTKGLTIFLTTHYMEEADQLCQRIAIVDHGKMLALDTPGKLKTSVPGGYLIDLQTNKQDDPLTDLQNALKAMPGVVKTESTNGRIRIYADKAEGMLAHAMKVASDQGIAVTDAHVAEPSLENFFLHLTGRSLRE